MSRAFVEGSHDNTLKVLGFVSHKNSSTSFSIPERGGSITAASKLPF